MKNQVNNFNECVVRLLKNNVYIREKSPSLKTTYRKAVDNFKETSFFPETYSKIKIEME
jgi:hypothetical protein